MWQVQDCGIDWNGPVTTEGDNDAVTIPSLPLDLINEDHERSLRNELSRHFDDKCGVEHYVMSRAFISGCHDQNNV